jgi:hypothetical protein
MTDIIPSLSKATGIPPQSLRSIAKILGVPNPETPEGVAMLVAFSHLQAYAAPEAVLGILMEFKGLKVVGVINRALALLDDVLVDLQDGSVVKPEAIPNIFEQHTVDVLWIATSILESLNAEASPAEPPQPPSTAGADPTATAPESP